MIDPFWLAAVLLVGKIILTLAVIYQFRSLWDLGPAVFAGPMMANGMNNGD